MTPMMIITVNFNFLENRKLVGLRLYVLRAANGVVFSLMIVCR